MQKKEVSKIDYFVKVIILGDSGVGKTNLLLSIVGEMLKTDNLSTMGIDYKIKTLQIEDKLIKFQIWDTAGQERFVNITQSYYKGTSGIIVAYSVIDRESFNHVKSWMKQIEQYAIKNVVKFLVGIKSDESDKERKIEKTEGVHLAAQYNILFAEVSVNENIEINQLFYDFGLEIK